MQTSHYALLSAENSHLLFQLQHRLEEAGIPAHIMPIPREICIGCGLCLRIPAERYAAVRPLLAEMKCTVYRMELGGKTRAVTPWQ